MCGRTACTLAPDSICKACSYKDKDTKKFRQPEWKESEGGGQYHPSHNLAPTNFSPVLISKTHFSSESDAQDWVVQPMMWGLIPPWHKGDPKSHNLSTNNCRLESMASSKLYGTPFNKGQRCVILADGFYEWQTTKGKGSKQPYFIYMPQPDGIHIEDPNTWEDEWDEDKGWKGPRLLKMAGLFTRWKSAEGEIIFSYTVITMDANDTLSWLHHRMPAILDNDEAVADWLDFGRVQGKQALTILHPIKLLTWHPVSTLVNNSRNKDPSCNKPVSLEEKPKPKNASSRLMESWLKKSPKKEIKEEKEDGHVAKKIKTEDE